MSIPDILESMKLGIKVAPDNNYQSDIAGTRPSIVEVWYNATKPTDYTEMFSYLKTQKLEVGLHFWGIVSGNKLANLSYPDPVISQASYELIKQTIDTAQKHGCVYVNIHPDLCILLHVDFSTMAIKPVSDPTDETQAMRVFTESVSTLHEYAIHRGVLLTIETVPMRDTPTWNPYRNRTKVVNIHQMPICLHHDLASRGMYIANDFCHTACNVISDDPNTVSDFLFATTKALAPQTKLIHLGFVIPPFNGTDFHDSLDFPLFDTDAVPNKKQTIELLKLFVHRPDVWALVEPKEDHVKNYFLAKKLIESASENRG